MQYEKNSPTISGDYEYSQIQEIFENEKDFKPVNEKDQVIIKALKEIINESNLKKKMLGAKKHSPQQLKKSMNQKISHLTKVC